MLRVHLIVIQCRLPVLRNDSRSIVNLRLCACRGLVCVCSASCASRLALVVPRLDVAVVSASDEGRDGCRIEVTTTIEADVLLAEDARLGDNGTYKAGCA